MTSEVNGLDSQLETVNAITKMMAILQVKFEWAAQAPCTTWKAHTTEGAAEFLKDYNEVIREGGRPHRVSQYFCGEDSPIRADFELHASGHGASEKLMAELLAYSYCTLDDGWVEGGHRDITGIQQNKRSATVGYIAASTRLKQNLKLWENQGNRARITEYFRKYKAMGHHPGRPRPRLPRFTRKKGLKLKQAIQEVYRTGAASLLNWSARFEGIRNHSPLLQPQGQPSLKAVTKLKLEYITLATQGSDVDDDYALYSLPIVTMDVVERARAAIECK